MVTARSTGKQVEDLSQRTETESVFANPDGTWTADVASEPERVQDSSGQWHDIDTTLVERDGALEPKYAASDLRLSDGGDATFASVSEDGKDLAWRWPTSLPAPTIDGDTATYVGAVDGGDLVVTATATGFTHSVVLRQRPTDPAAATDPVQFSMPVATDGAKLTESAAGGLVVKKTDGGIVAAAAQPLMWDATKDADGDPANVVPVDATVTQPGGTTPEGDKAGTAPVMTLTPDQSFLSDPDTKYPVTIDPNFTTNTNGDTWIENADYTASQGASDELRAGTFDGGGHIARSFLSFSNSVFSGKDVTAATLWMRNWWSGSCTSAEINAVRITDPWTVSGLTWANQPNWTATGKGVFSSAYGYSGSCPTDGAHWDVTGIVQGWAKGTFPNYGLRIHATTETANASWRRYRSVNYSDPAVAPRLVVTYNQAPKVPSAPAASSASVYTPAGSSTPTIYVPSTTPTFSTTVSDPDGGTVRGNFAVSTTAGGAAVSSCYSAASGVTSGQKASCAVSPALTDGGTYYARATALDGRLYSGATATNTTPVYSPSVKFVVDATAPTVSVASSGFTNGSWSPTAPASNTFNLTGPSDVTSYVVVEDGVSSTILADGSGDASVAWRPTSGGHTFVVTAVDRAGNRSAASSFSFGVGSAGIASPLADARSTSTFPLSLSGPPGSSGAKLQWRLAGDANWNDATAVKNGSSTWNGNLTSNATSSTTPDGLHWNAADEPTSGGTLSAPALVEIRGCFQFASGPDSCSLPRSVQLVPSALGGNFPVADLGPANVALFSGEATISGADAADSRAGFGRTFSNYDEGTTAAGVFGPGWSSPQVLTTDPSASATVVDNRAKDGSFVIVDAEGGAQTFVPDATSSTHFVPLEPTGDATDLTFTAGTPSTLVLSAPLGTGALSTSWTLQTPDSGGDPSWVIDTVDAPGTATDVGVQGQIGHPTFVRESDASAASTCNATRQAEACRALKISYTGTGTSARVASVSRLIGAASQADVREKVLATYTYDASNRLSGVCGPAPSSQQPALCTTYDYTTAGGRTLLGQVTPAGLKPWRFDYDSTGRLTTVRREKPAGGDATWSVDYSLSPSSSGLPDLSAGTAAQWGQSVVPTKVFAVYQPFLGAADVTKAQLYFTTDDGTVTNTASYGSSSWLVDTNWYDANGNVVQNLDTTGWARVQAAAVAARPQVAADASSYTVFNTWGDASTVGTRAVDEYGPAHTATLSDGTTGLFRTHTHTMYDDDPNVDSALIANRTGSAGLGLAVKVTSSASDAARTSDYDAKVTKYGYGPVVAGDGDGWTLGSPTTVSSQVDANSWSTQTTRYDSSGREIESRQPGGASDGSGAGSDAHATVTSYYTAAGTGDCGGKPAWAGLVCKVGPAGQPAGPPMPTKYTDKYDDDLNATSVQEVSGGVVARTTTTSYDALGRVTGVTKATTGSGVSNETIATSYGYDATTGLPTTTSSGGKTITTGYDAWGRTSSYTDALGTNSATTYDAAGNVSTFNDGAGTYTYSYGAHGQLASVDAGGGVGTFGYAYTPAGGIDSITYPNGVVAARGYNEIGDPTSLDYTQGGTDLLGFTATVAPDGRTIAQTSPASSQQFGYDQLGRLIKTEDTQNVAQTSTCTTRTYGFDASSNRNSFASYGPDSTGACQTSTATVAKTSTYDSAGRITNPGYTYDTLGRTLTTPQADAGPDAAGALTASYHADDMVSLLSQSVTNAAGGTDAQTMTYGLDPAERINSLTTTTNGSETQRLRYKFSSAADSPTSVETSTSGGNSWTATRYVTVPDLGIVASASTSGSELQLANLHGDIVATMSRSTGGTALDSYAETDEYGNAQSRSARYQWQGAQQRSQDALGWFTLMGARVYNASTGQFTSPDSIRGGNATPYTYPEDPINELDLDGRQSTWTYGWGKIKRYSTGFLNPTFYYRIWVNRDTLAGVAKKVGNDGAVLDAFSIIFAAAAVAFGITGVGAGALGLFAEVLGFSGAALTGLARLFKSELGKERSLAFKIVFTKGVHLPVFGYWYWSHYAWTLRA